MYNKGAMSKLTADSEDVLYSIVTCIPLLTYSVE
jgi:hypothetical protein